MRSVPSRSSVSHPCKMRGVRRHSFTCATTALRLSSQATGAASEQLAKKLTYERAMMIS